MISASRHARGGPGRVGRGTGDETLTKTLHVSYFALPLRVEMLFWRDRFTHFCLANCDTPLGTANPTP